MNKAVDLWMVYRLIRDLTTPFTETNAYKFGIIDDAGNVLRPHKSLTSIEQRAWTQFDIVVNNLKRLIHKLPFGRVRFASYIAAMWLLREPKVKQMSESQMRKRFTQFLKEQEALTEEVSLEAKALFRLIARQVRTGSAKKHGSFPIIELAEEFNTTPQAVRGVIDRIKDEFKREYRIELVYENSIRKPSVSGRNAFGRQGLATSINHPAIVSWRYLGKNIQEDAPANAAATGAVAGLTGDPPMMKRQKFAGHECFTVNDDVWSRCRMGKKKHTRYDSYVGEDEIGQQIRDFGLKNPKAPILLQHHKTGAFMYLRYGSNHHAFDYVNPKRESKGKK